MEAVMTEGTEVAVWCVLLYGADAELRIDGQDEPVRWPASVLAAETGLTEAALPGRRLVALLRETPEEGRVLSGFRVA